MTAARSLGRTSLTLLTANWGSGVMNLVIGILVARALGPEALGALAFSVGVSGVVMAALLPGFTQAHLKRVAEGLDPSRAVATLVTVKLLLYGAMALIVAAAGPWRHVLFDTPTLESVFLLLFAGTLASNFAEVFTVALLARELAAERGAVMLAARGARLVTTVVVLVVTSDVRWVAATYTLEGLVELVLSAARARARLGVRPTTPTRESLASYWRFARPLLVTVPIGMMQDSLDRVVVKQWAGLEAAGLYHVARGVWEILGSLLAAPVTFLFARMSALFGAKTADGRRQAQTLFSSAVEKLLFVTVPVAFVLWVFAVPAVGLVFGPRFVDAIPAVRIFVIAALAQTVVNPYTYVIYALDAHSRFVPVIVGRFVLYVLVLAVLVPGAPLITGLPALGLAQSGAALTRLFAVLFPAWVYVGWTRELASVGFERRTPLYLGGFAAALAVFHAITALGTGPGWPSVIVMPLAAVAGLGAYALWLRALHPGAAETLAYCLDLITPARLRATLIR